MKRSKDNRQTTYFRTDRFHRTNGYWYFLTREGKNVGPFENKKRAERELEFFLELRNVSVAKG